jgi:hypothetical protein
MLAILVKSRTQSQREKVTMETLHEGHPEKRSGNSITNAGFLPFE